MVDAGGYGLVIMFAGVVAALRGDGAAAARALTRRRASPTRSTTPRPTATARTSRSPARASRPAPWIEALEAIGDSVLVVGDAHDAEGPRPHRRARGRRRACSTAPARSRASTSPTCTSRCAQRAGRLGNGGGAATTCGVLAVVAGDGHGASCSTALGADAARRRPDAQPVHLRAAGRHPRRARPRRSSCCPNSPNVVMAAERAAELSEKTVAVVRDALAAGRARRRRRARPDRATRAANAAAMEEALAHVRTGAVTEAARDDAERRASAAATPSASSTRSSSPGASRPRRSRPSSASSARDAELVTLIAGDGAPLDQDAVAALAPDGVEVEYSAAASPLLVADLGRVAPPPRRSSSSR